MSLNRDARFVRTQGLASVPLDGDTVILNEPRNSYAGLDDIGGRIWDLLAEPRTVEELCRLMSEEYEGTRETIDRDVADFVAELMGEGLITGV